MAVTNTCKIWTVTLISRYNLIISIRNIEYCPGVRYGDAFYIGSPENRNYL